MFKFNTLTLRFYVLGWPLVVSLSFYSDLPCILTHVALCSCSIEAEGMINAQAHARFHGVAEPKRNNWAFSLSSIPCALLFTILVANPHRVPPNPRIAMTTQTLSLSTRYMTMICFPWSSHDTSLLPSSRGVLFALTLLLHLVSLIAPDPYLLDYLVGKTRTKRLGADRTCSMIGIRKTRRNQWVDCRLRRKPAVKKTAG